MPDMHIMCGMCGLPIRTDDSVLVQGVKRWHDKERTCIERLRRELEGVLLVVDQLVETEHYDSNNDCYHCGNWAGQKPKHSASCVWVKAKALIQEQEG